MLTAFSAWADRAALSADSAVYTESGRIRAVHAGSAFLTKLIRAVAAYFTASDADHRAVCTSVAAGTNHLHTGDAERALTAEVAVPYTVGTVTAVNTQFISCALTAFFITFGTDFCTFRASAAAYTDVFRTHLAGFAVIAEVSVAADTILADIASAADFFIRAGSTFFGTFRADRSALRASVAAVTDVFHTVFTFAALSTVVSLAANTVPADTAFAAELIISAGFAFFAALRTDHGTL